MAKFTFEEVEAPPVELRPHGEYNELWDFLNPMPFDKWYRLSGALDNSEIKRITRYIRNGKNGPQAKFRKQGIRLECQTSAKETTVYFRKTYITEEEKAREAARK